MFYHLIVTFVLAKPWMKLSMFSTHFLVGRTLDYSKMGIPCTLIFECNHGCDCILCNSICFELCRDAHTTQFSLQTWLAANPEPRYYDGVTE